MDLKHPDLEEEAKARGLWDGSGPLNFKEVGWSRGCVGASLPNFRVPVFQSSGYSY